VNPTVPTKLSVLSGISKISPNYNSGLTLPGMEISINNLSKMLSVWIMQLLTSSLMNPLKIVSEMFSVRSTKTTVSISTVLMEISFLLTVPLSNSLFCNGDLQLSLRTL
jgi:hypothetical protein